MDKKPLESFKSPLQMGGGDLWQLLRGEKGDKGEKGDSGKDGADGRDGIDGIDGKDGKDGTSAAVNIYEVVEAVLPLLPDADDIVKKVKKSLPKQKEVDLDALSEKFIPVGTKFSIKDIDELETLLKKLRDEVRNENNENIRKNLVQRGGPTQFLVKANGTGVSRVDSINFTNATVTPTGNGTSVDVTVAGGGSSVEIPMGTIDGSNTTFTVTNRPAYLSVDGLIKFETLNYTYSVGTITITDGAPPALFIRSIY